VFAAPRRLLLIAMALALLIGGPTAAALADNAGDQQYVDPFANGNAGGKQKPETTPAAKPRSGSPAPSGSSGSTSSGSSGATGSSGSSDATGSSGSSGSSGSTSSGDNSSGAGSGSGKHGSKSSGSGSGGSAAGSVALLAVAERVPVVGAVLRDDQRP